MFAGTKLQLFLSGKFWKKNVSSELDRISALSLIKKKKTFFYIQAISIKMLIFQINV